MRGCAALVGFGGAGHSANSPDQRACGNFHIRHCTSSPWSQTAPFCALVLQLGTTCLFLPSVAGR